MVVLVEVNRKQYLASIVPVIVNAILNEHQIIVDIVAFVSVGDFPRSRLGEKQRGKLLAGWVTRKIRTIAQFAIREFDPDALEGEGGDHGRVDEHVMHRHSMLSARSSGGHMGASSIRNVDEPPKIMEHEEFEQQQDRIADMTPTEKPMGMPDEQRTPTGYQLTDGPDPNQLPEQAQGSQQQQEGNSEFGGFNFDNGSQPPPAVGPKPGRGSVEGLATPQIRLPGVDGREDFSLWGSGDNKDQEDSWEADAIMHMNLTGDMTSPRSPT